MALKDSKTEQNLKDACAGESQANRRYLYFAQKADIERFNDVAAVFRSTAEGETGHAHGHLQYLEEVGDPATGEPIGDTTLNLRSAIAGETHEYTDMYPGMARTAREEGFDEIADWFETLAKAEKSHAGRFQKALDTMAWSRRGAGCICAAPRPDLPCQGGAEAPGQPHGGPCFSACRLPLAARRSNETRTPPRRLAPCNEGAAGREASSGHKFRHKGERKSVVTGRSV